MLNFKIVTITVFYLIFVNIHGSNCSKTDDILTNYKAELDSVVEKIEKDHFADDKAMNANDSQRSCISCIVMTLKEHSNDIFQLLKARANDQNDKDLDSSKIKELEKNHGNLESHGKIVDYIKKNLRDWGLSCHNGFPTGKFTPSLRIGSLGNIHSHLYEYLDMPLTGPTDKNLKTCMSTYVKTEADKEITMKFKKMFENQRKDLLLFNSNQSLTPAQNNCLGCIHMMLIDQTDLGDEIDKSDFDKVQDKASNLVANAYTYMSHRQEWAEQCLFYKPTYTDLKKEDYLKDFKAYKKLFMTNGNAKELLKCIDYYVDYKGGEDKTIKNVKITDCNREDCLISDYFTIL